MKLFSFLVAILALLPTVSECGAAEPATPSIAETFSEHFLIGAAIGTSQLLEENHAALEIVKTQFNSITPENLLKWSSVHPQPGKYDFTAADKYVSFGEANDMFIVGHTLVWHQQVPDWVFVDDSGLPLGRTALLERMREHIHTVVGRYKGRIDAWDVVNEALEDAGSLRDTPWRKAIGDDYLEKAFQFAHEADPAAELYYNDYSMYVPEKRDAAIKLVRRLKNAGCRVDGIGLQGHWALERPPMNEVEEALKKYAQLGVKLMITELDIDVLPKVEGPLGADVSKRSEPSAKLNPYAEGLPQDTQDALANRYAEIFQLFLRYPQISRVTFWGVDDGQSWLNSWPVPGRVSYPLLFDRSYQPKPAFQAVLNTIKSAQP